MAYQDLYNSYGGVNSMLGFDPYDTRTEETSANTQPVTQTIKFDPATGEQKMTISGRPEDLSAANPNTPTVTMPGQAPVAPVNPAMAGGYNPADMAHVLQQASLNYTSPAPLATMAQAGTSDVNPPAVTAPPETVTGANGRQVMAPQTVPGMNLNFQGQAAPAVAPAPMVTQQPGVAVQPAAAAAPVALAPEVTMPGGGLRMPAPPEQPVAAPIIQPPPAPVAAPEVQPTPVAPAALAAAVTPVLTPEQTYANRFYDAGTDTTKLNDLANDKEAPTWVRQMAVKSVALEASQRKQEIEAERLLKSGNTRDIGREIARDDDQGSILKVLFYNAIGAKGMSDTEQIKLGAGATTQQVTLDDGRTAHVRTRLDGVPMYGFDADGASLSQRELKQAGASIIPPGSKPFGSTLYLDDGSVIERYQTPTGGVLYTVTDPITGRKKTTNTAPKGASETKPEKGQITAVDQARFFQTEKKRIQDENEIEIRRSGPGAQKSDAQINAEAQASVANMVQIYGGGTRPGAPGNALATSGNRSAAAGNNPTGYGAVKDANGVTTWDTYPTPEAGVAATQTAVGRYLSGQGIMAGVKPTPENVVGMWVEGKPELGPKVQNGAYAASVRRELAAAGVQLNSDGTIPNTPAANAAVTRAMIVHESGAQNAQRFLPFVTSGTAAPAAPGTPPAAPGTPPAAAEPAANIWESTVKPEDRPPVRSPNQGDEAWKRANDLYTERQKLAMAGQDKYATELGKAVDQAAAQSLVIERVRQATIDNPQFFAIPSKSPAYQAFVNAQSDEKKADALKKLATELKIPEAKRGEFDATVRAIAQLQLNQITSSGLTASQLNTEKETARAIGPVGDIYTRPEAVQAGLVFKQAQIDYAKEKANQFENAKTANPNINERQFNRVFDEQFGNKIFKDAKVEIEKILKGGGTGGVTVNDRGQPTVGGFTLTNTRRPE
jgi:hypothetical protein